MRETSRKPKEDHQKRTHLILQSHTFFGVAKVRWSYVPEIINICFLAAERKNIVDIANAHSGFREGRKGQKLSLRHA